MRSFVLSPLERVTAPKLVSIYRPKVGVRRVQQLMNEADHLRWTRISSEPMLTSDHKQRRLEWAKLQLQKSPSKWICTIFSDEKRFCLDVPDGASHHWAFKHLDPRYFSTRQNGGGGVVVWGCFSAAGAPSLATIEGTMDSAGYCTILEKVLFPFAEDKHGQNWRFQQDNASVHRSNYTKTFFADTDVEVLE